MSDKETTTVDLNITKSSDNKASDPTTITKDLPRRFSLRQKEVKIEIEDSTGNVRVYTIVDLDMEGREQHMSFLNTIYKFNNDGEIVGYKTYKGRYTDLVHRCLRDPNGKQVPINVLEKWPDSVVMSIFMMCEDLSILHSNKEKEMEEAKNS